MPAASMLTAPAQGQLRRSHGRDGNAAYQFHEHIDHHSQRHARSRGRWA